MEQDDDPIPFELDNQPTFADISVRPLGHIVSPKGLELLSLQRSVDKSELIDATTTGWFFHSYITPPKGTFRFDSGREIAMPQFMFLPPGASMQFRSNPCITSFCLFGEDFIKGMVDAEPRFRFETIDCVVIRDTRRLAYLSQQMHRESVSPGFGASLLAEAIGLQIALEVMRCDNSSQPDETPLRGRLAPWQMRRLEAYVHAHLSGDLSLQHLADVLGMSARHLSRLVKREKGVGVHQWVADLRVVEAQRLLRLTRQPLHEIAQQAAFKSPAAFSTAFRAACGLSPSEYRRRAGLGG